MLAEQVPDLRPLGAKHERLRNVPSLLDEYADYYKFAFVRNPWDRLVSWYAMLTDAARLSEEDAKHCKRAKIRYNQVRKHPLWRYALEESSDFTSFVLNCTTPIAVKPGVFYSFAFNQLDYITDHSGNVSVDFVGRFERFNEDLDTVLSTLAVSTGNVPYRENTSQHGHYSKYYTDETRDCVHERYLPDISYFGYRFESLDADDITPA